MRVGILMVLAWAGVAGAEALPTLDALVALAPGEPVQFSKDVRPILADKCFACHGPDASARKANLRLDTEADAFAALGSGEGYALVRGDLAASAAFHRITTTDPDGSGNARAVDSAGRRVGRALVLHPSAAPHAAGGVEP